MGNLPTLKPREVVALLEGLGFAEVRQRGSHKQYRHVDGRGTTVPFHAGRDILAAVGCVGMLFLLGSALDRREASRANPPVEPVGARPATASPSQEA